MFVGRALLLKLALKWKRSNLRGDWKEGCGGLGSWGLLPTPVPWGREFYIPFFSRLKDLIQQLFQETFSFSYIFNHTRCKANIMSYLLPHPIPGVRVRAFVLVLYWGKVLIVAERPLSPSRKLRSQNVPANCVLSSMANTQHAELQQTSPAR